MELLCFEFQMTPSLRQFKSDNTSVTKKPQTPPSPDSKNPRPDAPKRHPDHQRNPHRFFRVQKHPARCSSFIFYQSFPFNRKLARELDISLSEVKTNPVTRTDLLIIWKNKTQSKHHIQKTPDLNKKFP